VRPTETLGGVSSASAGPPTSNASKESAAAQVAAQEAKRAEELAAAVEQEAERLRSVTDPIERLIRTISIDFAVHPSSGPRGGSGSRPYDDQILARMTESMVRGEQPEHVDYTQRDRFTCNESIARAVFPEYWSSRRRIDLEVNPPWNCDDVQRRFLRNVRGGPTHSVKVSRRTRLGGYKEAEIAAWMFSGGSTRMHPNVDLHRTRSIGIGIGKDGRRLYELGFEPLEPGERFNGRALVSMGKLAGLS
jgi:hypothetical protein